MLWSGIALGGELADIVMLSVTAVDAVNIVTLAE
jgi:hypothetical protein